MRKRKETKEGDCKENIFEFLAGLLKDDELSETGRKMAKIEKIEKRKRVIEKLLKEV